MTEVEFEKVEALRQMAQGNPDYFTHRENYIIRRRKEKANFAQIGRELDCTGSNANRIHRKILQKMKRARKWADEMINDDLYRRKTTDLGIAYAETPNANDIIRLLLPHITQIKELTK